MEAKVLSRQKLVHTFSVFPEHLNYAGTLFGGKLLAEMDIAAARLSRKLLFGSECDGAVTVKVGNVLFKNPANLGDFIDVEVEVEAVGNTSIDIKTIVTKETPIGEIEVVCEAEFKFVAVKEGKPHPHYLKLVK